MDELDKALLEGIVDTDNATVEVKLPADIIQALTDVQEKLKISGEAIAAQGILNILQNTREWQERIQPLEPYIDQELENQRATGGPYSTWTLIDVLGGLSLTGEIEDERVRPIIEAAQDRRFMAESYKLPTAPGANRIMEALQAKRDSAVTIKRKSEITHYQEQLTITDSGNTRTFSFVSNRKDAVDYAIITIANIGLAIANSLPAQRLFSKAMIELNNQALDNKGKLIRNYVVIPTSEFWGPGKPYKNADTAALVMKDAAKVLWSIGIEGQYKYSKNNTDSIEAAAAGGVRPFTQYTVDEELIYLYLNNDDNEPINWSFLAKFITILPAYYFELPARASTLLWYLCLLARQKNKIASIKKTGHFEVSLRAIQSRLALADDKTKHTTRDIKQPIIEAVEQIRAAHRTAYGDAAMTVTLQADPSLPIRSYLNTGTIRVDVKGELREYYSRRAEAVGQKIEEAKERQKRIEEAAAARRLSKEKPV